MKISNLLLKQPVLLMLGTILILMVFPIKANAAWDGTTYDYTWYDGHSSPYTISSPEQLAGLAKIVAGQYGTADNFSGKTISLTADIDLGSKAWVPIGTSSSYPFKGIFDGQSHVINGLYISSATSYTGLWGYTIDAQLHDIVINAPNVTGTNCVGALVGDFHLSSSSSSLLYNPYVYNCSVTGGAVNGNNNDIGGLIGCIDDPITSIYHDVKVYNCSTSCAVTETGTSKQHIAGLVGYIHTLSGATVYNCYTTGNISVTNGGSTIGGLVGYLDNGANASTTAAAITLHDCYSTGNINAGTSSGSDIGGLVGQFYEGGSTAITPSIYNCYATGNVTGYQNVGGLIGAISIQTNNSSYVTTINTCYSTGQITGGTGSSSGTGGIIGKINGNNTSAHITLTNIVALNSLVTNSTGSGVQRVVGYISNCNTAPTINNAYAYNNMLIGTTASPAAVISSSATSQNGKDIIKTEINSAINWSGTWFAGSSGCSFSDKNLPHLTATYVNTQAPMPIHLLIDKIWDGSTWINGVPTGTDDASIQGDYNQVADFDCNNLTINSGINLNIGAGQTVTINGNITNNGQIKLVSPSNLGTSGCLLNYGTLTNNGAATMQAERYVAAAQWHLVASPLNSSVSATSVFAAGDKIYTYDETQTTQNAAWISASTLTHGIGYLIKSPTAKTVTFGNSFFTGHYTTPALSYSNTLPTRKGYNLIANPYPCAIDWSLLYTQNSSISNTYWVWNGSVYATCQSDGSATNGGSLYIQPMQGFTVRATNTGQTVSFTDAVKTKNTGTQYFRNATVNNSIRLKTNGNNYSDDVLILFTPGANSEKMKSFVHEVPQLTIAPQGSEYAIFRAASVSSETIIPLEFECSLSGTYTITASELSLPIDVAALLVDKTSGTSIELNENTVYSFDYSNTESASRFDVVLRSASTTTGVNVANKESVSLQVYTENKFVVIASNLSKTGTVQIFDTVGKLLVKQNLNTEKTTIAMDKYPIGIYNVTIESNGKRISKKVIIK